MNVDLTLWRPHVQRILHDPSEAAVPGNPIDLYCVALALSEATTRENFPRIVLHIQRWVEAEHLTYAMVYMFHAQRQARDITQTREYVSLLNGPLGAYVTKE